MSDLTVNKIAFCVLGTGLLLIGVNEASHGFFHTKHHEKDGYYIELPDVEAGAGPAAPEGPRDYYALLTSASVTDGQAAAVKCLQCHSFDPGGPTLQGPPLYNIMGRDIGSQSGFNYSAAMAEMPGVWSYEAMDHFLESPRRYVQGTAMNFVGIRRQGERADLMAYLRTLTPGEPMPLPEPLPEVAPAEANGPQPEDADASPPVVDAQAPATEEAAPPQ